MNFPATDEYLILLNVVALLFFLKRKKHFDSFIFILIGLFVAINLLSALFFGSFEVITLGGFILRLIAPYLVIKVIGSDLLDLLPKFATVMAIVSIPFYLFQMLYANLLLKIFFYYPMITGDIRFSAGKYSLFFHTMDINGLTRNAGFLWEPGGFGYFLGMAIMLLLVRTNFKLTFQIFGLAVVGLTTLSTTFYLFLILTLIYFIAHTKRFNFSFLFLVPVFIVLTYYILTLDFMTDKIWSNYDNAKAMQSSRLGRTDDKLGRLGNFKIEIEEFFNYPIGYGINQNGRIKNASGEFASGPCGVSHHIARWGIAGIVLLVLALFKFSKYLNKIYAYNISYYPGLVIILFLFSNPIDRDTFLISILFLPFIINIDAKNSYIVQYTPKRVNYLENVSINMRNP